MRSNTFTKIQKTFDFASDDDLYESFLLKCEKEETTNPLENTKMDAIYDHFNDSMQKMI